MFCFQIRNVLNFLLHAELKSSFSVIIQSWQCLHFAVHREQQIKSAEELPPVRIELGTSCMLV